MALVMIVAVVQVIMMMILMNKEKEMGILSDYLMKILDENIPQKQFLPAYAISQGGCVCSGLCTGGCDGYCSNSCSENCSDYCENNSISQYD